MIADETMALHRQHKEWFVTDGERQNLQSVDTPSANHQRYGFDL